ncbi:MAG: hypothetical protein QOI35_1981 [Cryptosporangiaceae bacterium]|nr:hypothetical protein [Cryptosporangiaceae bacterium]
MDQVVQVAGSLLVLAAFALAQWGVLGQKSRTYLVLNTAGSAVLAVMALVGHQWGFLLLEGVWAIVSAVSLGQVLRGGPRADVRSSSGS